MAPWAGRRWQRNYFGFGSRSGVIECSQALALPGDQRDSWQLSNCNGSTIVNLQTGYQKATHQNNGVRPQNVAPPSREPISRALPEIAAFPLPASSSRTPAVLLGAGCWGFFSAVLGLRSCPKRGECVGTAAPGVLWGCPGTAPRELPAAPRGNPAAIQRLEVAVCKRLASAVALEVIKE